MTLDVTVIPTNAGAHSAILTLNDPSSSGIEYQTMNTVVAPYVPVANNYSAQVRDASPRAVPDYFFRVPLGYARL